MVAALVRGKRGPKGVLRLTPSVVASSAGEVAGLPVLPGPMDRMGDRPAARRGIFEEAVPVSLAETLVSAVDTASSLGRVTISAAAQTSRRRWAMLAPGTTAQAVTSYLVLGLPFLLPYLRRTEGLTLARGGALVAAPSLGMVVTLIASSGCSRRIERPAVRPRAPTRESQQSPQRERPAEHVTDDHRRPW